MKKLYLLAISAALGLTLTTSASATTYTYDFGQKLSGAGPETFNFASLSFNDITDMFTLNVKSSFSTLGTSAFIGSLAMDYSGTKPTVSNISGGGVSSVEAKNSNGPGNAFDYRFNFGDGENNQLKAGETVSWKSSNFLIGDLGQAKFALHVQGISNAGHDDHELESDSSAWYKVAVAPVPEPETYAMMLAGLGLIGWVARRRKSNV